MVNRLPPVYKVGIAINRCEILINELLVKNTEWSLWVAGSKEENKSINMRRKQVSG